MEVDLVTDPKKLVPKNGRPPKATANEVLDVLGEDSLFKDEWLEKSVLELGISRDTFLRRMRELMAAMRVQKNEEGKFVPPLIDLRVADDVHQILDPCPDEGGGVNQALLGACTTLHKLGYTDEEIPPMVLEWVEVSVSPERLNHIRDVELPRALRKSLNSNGAYFNTNPHVEWPKSDPQDVLRFAIQWGATTSRRSDDKTKAESFASSN
jgi:hypothetical protein